jgi:hypothetical protein
MLDIVLVVGTQSWMKDGPCPSGALDFVLYNPKTSTVTLRRHNVGEKWKFK